MLYEKSDYSQQHFYVLDCLHPEVSPKNKTAMVPQPPYVPYQTPADFLLFPKMEVSLKGQ
jgi:hypothetical protein